MSADARLPYTIVMIGFLGFRKIRHTALTFLNISLTL